MIGQNFRCLNPTRPGELFGNVYPCKRSIKRPVLIRSKTPDKVISARKGRVVFMYSANRYAQPRNLGSEYIPWLMEDRSGTVDEDEEEGNCTHHSVIQMVLFPTVLRWGFDEAGMLSGSPIVIRKATVMATPPETGAEI